MNIASVYEYIYLFVVVVMTFSVLKPYQQSVTNDSFIRPNNSILVMVLLFAVFIGVRPVSGRYFVDMRGYANQLEMLSVRGYEYTWDTDNKIFDNLIGWWGTNDIGETAFFLFMATLYFGCAGIGLKRLFKEHAKVAYVVFLAAFSTFSFATNGIKAGAAASIFIMALGFLDKKWLCIPLMLVSLGFHHSMELPIGAFLIVMIIKNPKWFYWGWAFCLLMACLHVTSFQTFFGSMTDEQGAGYLYATKEMSEAHMGFRPDFILYSAVPVWIGYKIEIKQKLVLSKFYTTILHFYMTTNAVWMLCMYAAFNNRIAYLSWFVYPIVVIYPFLDNKNTDPLRKQKFINAVKYHLYFTLFMVCIYYGFLSL